MLVKTWLAVITTSGAKAYTTLIGMLLLIYTARTLGPELRGQVSVIMTWSGLIATVSYFSVGQVALNRMSKDPKHTNFGELLGALLTILLLFTSFIWISIFIYLMTQPENIIHNLSHTEVVIALLFIPFLIWEYYSSALLTGLQKLSIYNFYQIIGRTTAFLATFVFIFLFGPSITSVVIAALLGQIIISVGGLKYYKKFLQDLGQSVTISFKLIGSLIVDGAKLHISTVGTYAMTSLNVLVLNHYVGPADAGYLQLGMQLLNLTTIIASAASMVIYGKIASSGADTAWLEHRKLIWQIVSLMCFFSVLGYLFAPQIITRLLGSEYQDLGDLFKIMVFCSIGMTLSILMAPQWIGRGYFALTSMLTLVVVSMNIIGNFTLIPLYGAQGAVIMLLLTYGVALIVNSLMVLYCEYRVKMHLNKS